MNPSVGIDLGTTNTVVGVQTDDTGPWILKIPQPVTQRSVLEERDEIKSAVLFEPHGSAVVGVFASNRLDALHSVKSHMGTRWSVRHSYDKSVHLTPAFISAHILRLGYQHLIQTFPKWDRSAVITVPASFNTDQRADTLLASKMAGFSSVRLLDEPSAAYYYHFNQFRDDPDSVNDRTVLVFDFGGGTLDVSIIRVNVERDTIVIDPIGRSRYNNIGGDDIDLDLAVFFLACWEYQSGIDLDSLAAPLLKALYKLFVDKARAFKEEAEDYIAQEMELNEFTVDEDIFATGCEKLHVQLRRTIERSQYEEITGRFIHSKEELNIFRPIGQAMDVARSIVPDFEKEDVDLVLYTGGSSRMRSVQRELASYFRPKPCFSISNEEACNTVALGAACCRYDEMHANRQVRMTSRLLEGILTRNETGTAYVPIVPLTCEPSSTFTRVPTEFRTTRQLIKHRIPLFRGVGPTDHQLAPMRDLILPIGTIVEADTPYYLSYRMTQDKTVEIRAEFCSAQGNIEATGQVALDNKATEGGSVPKLCKVNEVGSG